jgi:hypothetical protein
VKAITNWIQTYTGGSQELSEPFTAHCAVPIHSCSLRNSLNVPIFVVIVCYCSAFCTCYIDSVHLITLIRWKSLGGRTSFAGIHHRNRSLKLRFGLIQGLERDLSNSENCAVAVRSVGRVRSLAHLPYLIQEDEGDLHCCICSSLGGSVKAITIHSWKVPKTHALKRQALIHATIHVSITIHYKLSEHTQSC